MLPNVLSIIRILFIPVYLYFFLRGNFLLAGIFFSLSAFTDFLDGYFARKYNLTTKLGRILDPLADKLTVISILIALIYTNLIPKIIITILLIREIFIFISSGITYLLGYDVINPSNIGKFSIFLLYLAIAMELLKLNEFARVLFYIVIPINIYSGINYILTTIKILKNNS